MAEIHQIRKLNVMGRPDSKDSADALSRIRTDIERAHAEYPFRIAINKIQSCIPRRQKEYDTGKSPKKK